MQRAWSYKLKMAHFDEKSGLVPCDTSWGTWAQTIDEVFLEINLEEGTKSKDIKVDIGANRLSVNVAGKKILEVI